MKQFHDLITASAWANIHASGECGTILRVAGLSNSPYSIRYSKGSNHDPLEVIAFRLHFWRTDLRLLVGADQEMAMNWKNVFIVCGTAIALCAISDVVLLSLGFSLSSVRLAYLVIAVVVGLGFSYFGFSVIKEEK